MGRITVPYALLKTCLELNRRYLRESAKSGCLCSSTVDAHQFWYAQLNTQDCEVFAAVFFDDEQHLIDYEEIWCGSMDETLVLEELVKEVVERALHHQATAVTLAHFSPTGDGCPMPIDLSALQMLQGALEAVCVTLSDYLVMGKGCSVSLRERTFLS